MLRYFCLGLISLLLWSSAFAGDDKKEVLTLSKGKYVETFDQDSIEVIGNILYNVNSRTIVGFIDEKEEGENAMPPEIISRWLSIDPLASKFPSQSPYCFAANNPIYFVDIDGLYQYPASKAAAYKKEFPMLTKYLSSHIQNDMRKSTIVQNAIVKNTYGGYTNSELVENVAKWSNKNSPTITFEKGLTAKTNGSANAHTSNSKDIQIDYDYAKNLDNMLSDKNVSQEDKQAAITKFYGTMIDETTHTGDLKDGFRSADEVGGDAKDEIFHLEPVTLEDGTTIKVYEVGDIDDPTNNKDLSGTKNMIDRKKSEGKSEVLPTVPTN
ncbi:hypothetical protein F0919_14080 [Taibaiella lutea]|uniref:RHS repeat-associated core domain-containing protein n=1 Tax=Taibaiella lutea TaxID=2608001 RepID=A0A5M6CEW1_9BACT|nr:hypothetical protein [Taibaiella lutea]KAA5533661.1 hypothetical protein F0919_14080 [Taibaiella lutea]